MNNPFPGINPHLNSLLQTPGTDEQPSLWFAFHSAHVNHVADHLNMHLPPNYTAYSEQSLQIVGVTWAGDLTVNCPQPVFSIFRQQPSAIGSSEMAEIQPTWEATVAELIEPVKHLPSVVIREASHQSSLGTTVTRIELLSPSNKPGGRDASIYQNKRIETIQTGVPLVEIDYLHESHSPIYQLPAYPHEANAYPYWIIVTDPRPNWEEGKAKAYGFGIQEPLPCIPIPLAERESITIDFNPIYQQTFVSRRYANLLNYGQSPARMDTYRTEDQAYIQQRMTELSRLS